MGCWMLEGFRLSKSAEPPRKRWPALPDWPKKNVIITGMPGLGCMASYPNLSSNPYSTSCDELLKRPGHEPNINSHELKPKPRVVGACPVRLCESKPLTVSV